MTKLQAKDHSWRMCKVVLQPARGNAYAPNSVEHGYEIVAPLDPSGLISLEGWRSERARCFVHKTEHGGAVEKGVLVHRPGGAEGATWAFDYDPTEAGDEEAGYRFGAHAFKPGEYVSVREDDGVLRTYRVTAVKPI